LGLGKMGYSKLLGINYIEVKPEGVDMWERKAKEPEKSTSESGESICKGTEALI
jgi:hypothetical protein